MKGVIGAAELLLLHPARLFASLLPFSIAILLVLLANIPVTLTGGLVPAPLLALTAIYFWGLVRPDLMPPSAVLWIGLLEDIVSGGPPGLWAAGFLAAYAVIDRRRDDFAGLSGGGAVIGFAAAAMTAAASAYLLEAIVYLRFPPLAPMLVETVGTIAFFPLIAPATGWLHRRIVGPLRRDE